MIAFSTRNLSAADGASAVVKIEELQNDEMDPLFLATVEAVEEVVYNSLLAAKTVRGRDGHTIEAIPLSRLKEIFRLAKK